MKIAVDAMGGDHAPAVILDGVKLFLESRPAVEFILVGPEALLKSELARTGLQKSERVRIAAADEIIAMSEAPTKALRNKKNSSINVMADLAKDGQVDAILSAGNTGAVVAASTLKLRTLEGIDRPAIATLMPTPHGQNLLMDVGAVTDCKVKNYLQFGIMGTCFARQILGIPSPKVGLLNVGEEESKGDGLHKEVYGILKASSLNFIGNVEGRDLFSDRADIIVTNGFVGNIVLKACEGLAREIFNVTRKEVGRNFLTRLGGALLIPAFRNLRRQFDHEEYGGALLLGINGVVIISHGSSTAISIKNALKVAKEMVEKKVNQAITQHLNTTHD